MSNKVIGIVIFIINIFVLIFLISSTNQNLNSGENWLMQIINVLSLSFGEFILGFILYFFRDEKIKNLGQTIMICAILIPLIGFGVCALKSK